MKSIPPGNSTEPVVLDPDDKARIGKIQLIGHDMRTAIVDTLNGVRELSNEDLPPKARLQIERMRAACESMLRLIEEGIEVIDNASVGPPRQTVPLKRLIHDLDIRWRSRAEDKGLTFLVEMAPEVPAVVQLDRIALERVLSNMLSNAVKYTDHGTVRLQLSCTDPQGPQDQAKLRLSVHDEGPGFDDAVLETLFAHGRRGQLMGKAGNGFGMSIALDMAHRLGARLDAINHTAGCGAEVRLDIPLEGLVPADLQPQVPLPDLSRMHVLIADDSKISQAVLEHMLTAMGARCVFAFDGADALQYLEYGRYDLLVVDAEMPRLSGRELIGVLRRGRSHHAQIPIIACTAHAQPGEIARLREAGADAVVCKPIDRIDPLAAEVRRALTRPGMPPLPAADDTPLLDAQIFEALLDLTGPEGANDLLERLLEDLDRIVRGLTAALSERNPREIRANAHVLISVAGTMGAEPLRAQAELLATAARLEDYPRIQRLGPSVLSQTDRLIAHAWQRRESLGGA